MYAHNITSTGTVRANKREIPLEFLNIKRFDLSQTKYSFNEELRIIGYCPKPKKVVLLMSTEHHSKNIMPPKETKKGFRLKRFEASDPADHSKVVIAHIVLNAFLNHVKLI